MSDSWTDGFSESDGESEGNWIEQASNGPDDFEDRLEDGLTKFLQKKIDESDDRHGYHPSQGYGLCTRKKALMQFYQKEDIITPDLQMRFDIGHMYHEMIQEKWLGPMGVLKGEWECPDCGYEEYGFMPEECVDCGRESSMYSPFVFNEVPVKDDQYGIVGHGDGILELDDLEPRLVDIKTTSWIKYARKGDTKKRYVYQLQIYMSLLGLDYGVIMFFDKKSAERHYVHIQQDDQFIEDYREKIEKDEDAKPILEDGIEEEMLEEEPFDRICSDKEVERAKNCPVSKECFKHEAP